MRGAKDVDDIFRELDDVDIHVHALRLHQVLVGVPAIGHLEVVQGGLAGERLEPDPVDADFRAVLLGGLAFKDRLGQIVEEKEVDDQNQRKDKNDVAVDAAHCR